MTLKQPSQTEIAGFKIALFLAGAIPFARLALGVAAGSLGPDPVAEITRTTGDWTLNLLLVTLGISPLRRILGWTWLLRLRRMVALYAFFYASLHLLAYVVFDCYFDWREIGQDILYRPYLTVGFLAYVLMIPLALTSTNAMMRRLGGPRWKALHRLVYLIAVCAVFHYFWLVKRDITVPSYYVLVLISLFSARWVGRPSPNTRSKNLTVGSIP